DAQYFGVAQRRRRVFVVGHLGDGAHAAEVLLEPEGGGGDPPARRTARTQPSARSGGCLASNGDIIQGLTGGLGSGGPDAQHAQAGWLIPTRATDLDTVDAYVVGPLTAGMGKGPRGSEAVESRHL